MSGLPIPPNNEPLTTGDRPNDNWWRYWEADSKALNALTTVVSAIPIVNTTTYAQTILASTTASVARTALGLGTAAVENITVGSSWTPNLAFGGTTTAVAYTTRQGRYVKIGKFVQLFASLGLSNNGDGVGTATIDGYTSFAGTPTTVVGLHWVGQMGVQTGVSAETGWHCAIESTNNAAITLYRQNSGQALAADNNDITDTASFSIAVSYYTS